MNILITGACGYISYWLINKLLASNLPIKKIVGYDNLMYKQVSNIEYYHRPEFEFIKADVREQDKLLKEVQKADVIIPLAAYVGAPCCDADKRSATEINFEQIKFIVDNMSKDQMLIYPNTDSAYGSVPSDELCVEETPLKPVSHYGITKTNSEMYIRDKGIGVVVRLATVFGVSQRMRLDLLINDFTFKAVNDGYIVLFEKAFKRNFCHVQDVASAFVFLLERYKDVEGQVYNVGNTSANHTKFEVCELIQKFLPRFVVQCDEFATDQDKRNYQVSNRKLEGLGWSCKHSVEDGIQELIKAYKIITPNQRRNYNNI